MIDTITKAADDQLVPVADLTADLAAELEETEDEAEGWLEPVARRNQRGMVSAEWAVGIIAAIAIAGVLLSIVTSGPVKAALLKVILMIIGMFTQNAHFLKL